MKLKFGHHLSTMSDTNDIDDQSSDDGLKWIDYVCNPSGDDHKVVLYEDMKVDGSFALDVFDETDQMRETNDIEEEVYSDPWTDIEWLSFEKEDQKPIEKTIWSGLGRGRPIRDGMSADIGHRVKAEDSDNDVIVFPFNKGIKRKIDENIENCPQMKILTTGENHKSLAHTESPPVFWNFKLSSGLPSQRPYTRI